jgi:phosphatidylglycerol:prolipoprotein diacylglycerol transferase
MEITVKHDSSLILKKILEVGIYVVIFVLTIPSFFYLFGSLCDRIINPFSYRLILLEVSGITLLGLGASIMIMAVIDLGKSGRGLPASPVPPINLVSNGLYGLSRHPIYFGASLSFLGGSMFLHSFWSIFLSWPLFTLFFISYAHCIEEPVLEKRFQGEYRLYKEGVPMLWEFPFQKSLLCLVRRILCWMSGVVNRPFVLEYRSHILFLGYGLWVGFGAFVGLTVLNFALLGDNISSSSVAWLTLLFTVITLAGSRLVSMIVLMILEKKTFKTAWYRVGFVSWGALLAVFISGVLFHLFTKKAIYYWLDAAFMGLMINHFFGRIGCLFYGCCYGKETRSTIHVHFTHPCLKALREGHVRTGKLYPSQVYSAIYGLFIFTIIFFMWGAASIRVGAPTSMCFILYGIFRFIEEWYRYQKRTVAGFLSPAQIVTLALIFLGILQLGWILPLMDTGYHSPLFQHALGNIMIHLKIWLVASMGALTAFVFSYHRYEIGAWGRLGIIQKDIQGAGNES